MTTTREFDYHRKSAWRLEHDVDKDENATLR